MCVLSLSNRDRCAGKFPGLPGGISSSQNLRLANSLGTNTFLTGHPSISEHQVQTIRGLVVFLLRMVLLLSLVKT